MRLFNKYKCINNDFLDEKPLNNLLKHKSLLMTFAISDLKIRYRGSVLGFFWTILEPLLILSVLYLVFTNVFRAEIENYAIYLLLGIVMWNFFTRSTSMGLNSFILKSGLITKTYFPREILPVSSCITAFIMSLFEFTILFIFFAVFSYLPPITIVFLLPLIGLEFVLVLGLSFFLSVLNVRYRDLQYIWNVVIYAGFFAVPIMYSLDILPPNIQELILLNPMAQIIEMSHHFVLYNTMPEVWSVIYTVIITGIVFGIGYAVFKFIESKVVEEL